MPCRLSRSDSRMSCAMGWSRRCRGTRHCTQRADSDSELAVAPGARPLMRPSHRNPIESRVRAPRRPLAVLLASRERPALARRHGSLERPGAQPARRTVSLVVSNGIVVTVDTARRVLRPGAVAIDGGAIVGIDTPEAIAAQFDARDTIDAAGQIVHAGADQHPHPRADGALSGAGRRPGADGVAAAVHLPGRGQDRVAGVRADRHAAGRARDDPVGDHHVRRHVLLRGGDRQGDEGSGPARRARADDHQVSGRRMRRRRPSRWPGPRASSRSGRATR